VKPAPFTYLDPPSLDEVLAALAEHGDDAAVIAGGQSLLPLMNLRLARPEVVVDPRRVPGLRDITVTSSAVVVGAMATATEVLEHPDVTQALPGLTEAISCIGHSQIRNRTTIGGSVAHADPSSELPAVLAGLDGEIVLRSATGERRLAAAAFFDGSFSTTRRADELVTEVRFPIPAGRTAWDEVARRPGDFALAGLFAALAVEDGLVRQVRLAFSGLADRPVRASGAEAALLDRPLDADALDACTEALLAELTPTDDGHASGRHRAALAATLVRRVLSRLAP
jgi:carbon-monoxide dehydrogenase medium subunit